MGFVDFERWMYSLLERRRQQPQHDLMSKVIEAQRAGGKITDREIVTNLIGMVAAGTDTTANTIGQMVNVLLSNPEQFQLMRERPELRPQ